MIEKQTTYYRSPIGMLEIIGSDDGISSIAFVEETAASATIPACLRDGVNQLDEYFNHERTEFSFKLDLCGTGFQKRVWHALLNIPFGKTISYRDVALALGDLKAIRAIGRANGQNPLAIVIPCHRVIGADGSLTGYGGGLWRKDWLLNFEGALNVRVMHAPSG